MNEALVIYLVVCAVALIVVSIASWLWHRSNLKKQAQMERKERQYREAEEFTKQIIEQQIEYANSLHAIDTMTIRAFEAIVEELATRRNESTSTE